ncbi:MAG: peroxiredoxin [Microscillaceae bacterium]|nr:peroxiredoxin [Microscillaceae bacterium]MDW8461916.1 peroxiredoxin [Cytophagales bacterium]
MTLVLKKAPTFKAVAVVNGKDVVKDFSLEQYLGQKYVVFFFYPKDFSGVCPSEVLAFQERLADFENLGAVVVGCSTDSAEVHKVWLKTPHSENGIQGVTYPLVADETKTIAANYGVLAGEYFYDEEGKLAFEGSPIALRGTFIINKDGIIKYESVNFFTAARDIEAILRELEAVIHTETTGGICLANWKKQKAEVVG